MGQIKLADVVSNLELNIRWICDNPAHQFPGYVNVEMAMRDALELLKEQQQQIWEMQDRTEYLEDKLKKQPQIVRCKDCLWNSGTAERPYCQHHSTGRTPEWFCASGEKRF